MCNAAGRDRPLSSFGNGLSSALRSLSLVITLAEMIFGLYLSDNSKFCNTPTFQHRSLLPEIPSTGPSWQHLPRKRLISFRSVEWLDDTIMPLQRYRSVNEKKSGISSDLTIKECPSNNVKDEDDGNIALLKQIANHSSEYNLSKTSLSLLENCNYFSAHQREKLVQKIRIEEQATKAISTDNLEILYCDEHICVTNKPSGALSVPGPRRNPSLANLVYDTIHPSGIDLDQMVVHRLDMATSGILIFALSLEALSKLHADFKDRRVQKTYQALVFHEGSSILSKRSTMEGEIDVDMERDPNNPPFMRISRPKQEEQEDKEQHATATTTIGRITSDHKFYKQAPKASLTSWTVLSREMYCGIPVSRLELRPWTGRTHQLRVHCAQAMGAPIVGDDIYGGGGNDCLESVTSPLCLHARQLCIYHPISGASMIFEADPPF